jgi:hypothetical protein
MVIHKVEEGKARILSTLIEVGNELNVPLPTHEWKQQPEATVYDGHILVFHAIGKDAAIDFSFGDICDCTDDPTVLAKIKARLKGFLRSV